MHIEDLATLPSNTYEARKLLTEMICSANHSIRYKRAKWWSRSIICAFDNYKDAKAAHMLSRALTER